jgi:hypothetical protein
VSEPRKPPPQTTLGLILHGLPPDNDPLARAVTRVEGALDRLDQVLRQQAAKKSEQ